MKLPLAIIALLFTPVLYGQIRSNHYDPAKLYPVDSLKADLRFLQNKLEKMHPGLYRYSGKAEMAALFDSLNDVIREPMNEQQFLSLLMLVQARIRNGHTMFLPGDSASAYNAFRGRFLPFEVRMIDGRLLIGQNFSTDSVERGTEILSINGVNSGEVWRQLMARQIRDGYNETYPEWILDHYFFSYYGFVFGQPGEFRLEIRKVSGDTAWLTIRALTKDSIGYFRQKRYPGFFEGPRLSLMEIEHKKVAVLKAGTMDADLLGVLYQQSFFMTVESAFHQLRQNGDSALIIDLRDNQGGKFAGPRWILARLINQPTKFLVGGAESALIHPAKENFTGRLVVLVNGGSFSATAMLAATLKRDRRAVFVGEETGGNPFVISGDPEEVILPHSGINCQIATKTYRITKGVNTGRGLMPEYPVKPEAADWLTGKDRAMETAERLAKRE
jgi:peptidase S41-like protein